AALAGVSAESAGLLCLVERDLGAELSELGVIGSACRGWMRRRWSRGGLIVGGAVVQLEAGSGCRPVRLRVAGDQVGEQDVAVGLGDLVDGVLSSVE
ncbi:MAG: hypothetical protein ABI140_10700, partial [Jatrophihabitantaceae bacterium]